MFIQTLNEMQVPKKGDLEMEVLTSINIHRTASILSKVLLRQCLTPNKSRKVLLQEMSMLSEQYMMVVSTKITTISKNKGLLRSSLVLSQIVQIERSSPSNKSKKLRNNMWKSHQNPGLDPL